MPPIISIENYGDCKNHKYSQSHDLLFHANVSEHAPA